MADRIPDRRVRKTRSSLQDALIALIADSGYDAITVKGLLDKANIGRSTFYLHFDGKEELLHSCFEDFGNRLDRHESEMLGAAQLAGDDAFQIFSFLRFVGQNHLFFKTLMGEHGVERFTRGIHDHALRVLDELLGKQAAVAKRKPLQMDMLVHYVTDGFMGLLKWWVGNDMPSSAEELGQYILHQVAASRDAMRNT